MLNLIPGRAFQAPTAGVSRFGFQGLSNAQRGSASVRGFTMLEVLVVIVIIAVLAGAMSLTVNFNSEQRELMRERERLIKRIRYARDFAIQSQRVLALVVFSDGLKFLILDDTDYDFLEYGLESDVDTAEDEAALIDAADLQPTTLEQTNTEETLSWQLIESDTHLSPMTLPEAARFELDVAQTPLELEYSDRVDKSVLLDADPNPSTGDFSPQVYFLPSGQVDPFVLVLQLLNQDISFGLRMTQTAQIKRLESEDADDNL